MKRKHRRLALAGLVALGVGGATALTLAAFEDNILFFYSPSDIVERGGPPAARFRIGGLVAEGSIANEDTNVTFTVTDTAHELQVVYAGLLPDLFREGQGVVAHGSLDANGVFQADEVLARHDENYMPPEVAEALDRAGQP